MAKFLHIADIHLGFDRYDSSVRTTDFFRAFWDVLERYAIGEAVDFVLIAGDLFEHRMIQPAILNQAQLCLQQLQTAGIPVLAIEGNHDNRPYGTNTSWLRYLADWGLLKLLEPGNTVAGEPLYAAWDEHSRRGGYLDLDCGVRILGSAWYGAAAPRAIEQIAQAIAALPPGPEQTILLFHHGLEGQIARYAGALRYGDLQPLRAAGVDYLALGHIHKHYQIEGWIFNPGSLEANNIEESTFERGALLVEIDAQGVRAELKTDYWQRPMVRLRLTARGQEDLETLQQAAMATVEQAIASGQLVPEKQPIVELRIDGQVGFDRLELDTRHLQQVLQARSQSLILLLKYDVDEVAYGAPLDEVASRQQIEREVFLDLLTAHSVYQKRAEALTEGLIDLKERQLASQPETQLYELVEQLLEAD